MLEHLRYVYDISGASMTHEMASMPSSLSAISATLRLDDMLGFVRLLATATLKDGEMGTSFTRTSYLILLLSPGVFPSKSAMYQHQKNVEPVQCQRW